jgi:hypothetical protein
VFSGSGFREEGVVRIVLDANVIVVRHQAVGCDPVFKTIWILKKIFLN